MDESVGAAVVGGGMIAISLLLKATLILGVAWILAVAARRSSAAVRHGIWVAALLGAVTLPLTTLWLPPLEIELPLGLVAEGTRPDGPGAPAVATTTLGADANALSGGVAAPIGGSVIGDRFATEPRDTPGLDWLLTLLAVWLLGTLARAGWLGAQLVRVRHLTRHAAAPVRDDRVAAVGDIGRLLRTRRPVVLLESARIATPLTYGLLRPVILLPEDSREWPEDRLRVVLLHELAHIRRWDYVTCLIAEAACALYWPVPLVWIARRSVQAEQEQASDDLVLAAGTPAVDYADHLLAIARTLRGESRTLAATIGMAREIGLKRRIRTILDGRTRRNPLRSWHGALTLIALCGFSLPVAAIRAGTGVAEEAADLSASALAPALLGMPAPAVTPPEADVYLWLEAEHGLLRGAMEPREDLDASDGHFVAAAGERDAGEAILSLNLPRAGQYAVWARVAGGATDDRGLRISLDDRELGLAAREAKGESSQGWRWIRLEDAGSGFLMLAPGIHTLRLVSSSGDRHLDRVLVTSDGDYLPSGRGASPVGFLPQYSWIDVGAGAVTGAAEYVFEVETPGSYVLWGRVLGRDGGANSLFFSVDDGPELIWDAPRRNLGREQGRWTWDPASAREIGGRSVDPLILDLTPGQHTVRLRARESGTGLSGLLVTNDLTYRPRGNPPGTPTVQVWLEPETAAPAGGLRVRRGGGAVGVGYLEATGRGRRVSDPGEDGSAALRFNLPHSGVYTVWARTIARTGGEDSFWIRVNDEPWVRWNGIPRSSEWRWSAVHDSDGAVGPVQFALPAGENRIEIARREGGTRLDRLLLTNQDRFEPAGTGAE